jgi:hypothetical protein
MGKSTQPGKTFLEQLQGLKYGALIGAIAAFLVIYFAYKNMINEAIHNPEVIKKIQDAVKPSLIFDQNGSILSDQGGQKLIGKLKVTENKNGFVERIVVPLNDPNACPILTSLDNTVTYSINPSRGEMSDVIFDLELRGYSKPRPSKSLFKLEFVPGMAIQRVYDPTSAEKATHFPGVIVAEGLDMIRKPGQARLNMASGTPPTYQPTEGDTYYDTRWHSYLVYSEGKWKKLSFEK